MKKLLSFLCMICFYFFGFCQSSTVLLFGHPSAGLDFRAHPPLPITSKMNTYGTALICQDRNNDIKFYSNGDSIWDNSGNGLKLNTYVKTLNDPYSNFEPLYNLSYINAPINSDTFLIITCGQSDRGIEKLSYQRVIINAIDKKINLIDTLPQYFSNVPIDNVITIKHANNKDYWIIGADKYKYYVYLYNGNNFVLINEYNHNEIYRFRKFCISNSGSFWLSLNHSYNSDFYIRGVIICKYTFDTKNGIITKKQELLNRNINDFDNYKPPIVGISLSPNDSLLYYADIQYSMAPDNEERATRFYQLDLNSSSLTPFPLEFDSSVVFSNTDMILAPNNEILIYSNINLLSPSEPNNYFHRIKFPNRKGAECKLELNAIKFRNINFRPINVYFYFPIKTWQNKKFDFSFSQSCDFNVKIKPDVDSSIKRLTIFYNQDSITIAVSDSLILHQNSGDPLPILIHATNNFGEHFWYEDTVKFISSFSKPTAKFTVVDTAGCQWINYVLLDQSNIRFKNKPITYNWQFGDGKDTTLLFANVPAAAASSVGHTYTQNGLYKVSLIVNDGYCADTFSLQNKVNILPAPQPGILLNPNSAMGCSPLDIAAQRRFTDPIDSVIWQLGEGSQQTAYTNPAAIQHTYYHSLPNTQNYLLQQTLYGPTGCITKDSLLINVQPGFEKGYVPTLIRASVENENTALVQWTGHPHAKGYTLFKDNAIATQTNDTFFVAPYTQVQNSAYWITANNACEQSTATSNLGQLMVLTGENTNNKTALLQWTAYQDWSSANGVLHYTIEAKNNNTGAFEALSNNDTTYYTDNNFIQSGYYNRCYRITATQANNTNIVSHSNTLCLGYESVIFVPNAFSPNNDGLNDVFEPFNIGFKSYTLSVYNRWGEKIAEGRNWDGTTQGQTVPNGIYFYRITGKTGKDENVFLNGQVTVVR